MRLHRLALRNYRNYSQLDLELAPGLNVILGQNAQGKTNLLEAVALLALSSSPRARRESELIGPLTTAARIEGRVERQAGAEVEVVISLDGGGDRIGKSIRVNGQARRAVDLPGEVNVTLFWPEDLGLVKSGPELRRRFLNEMLVQVVPGYARNLAGYRRALEQRNGLLRRIAAREEGAAALEAWDATLASHGDQISQARAAAVAELAPLAAARHLAVSGGEQMEIRYLGSASGLAARLQASLPEDLRRGMTSVGPHRDELDVLIGGQAARSYASQGQQRTAVIALKLGEADLIERRRGERPIMLLDDVLSELDFGRRRQLLSSVGSTGQVLVTAVDAEVFPGGVGSDALVRCISQGRVDNCG